MLNRARPNAIRVAILDPTLYVDDLSSRTDTTLTPPHGSVAGVMSGHRTVNTPIDKRRLIKSCEVYIEFHYALSILVGVGTEPCIPSFWKTHKSHHTHFDRLSDDDLWARVTLCQCLLKCLAERGDIVPVFHQDAMKSIGSPQRHGIRRINTAHRSSICLPL